MNKFKLFIAASAFAFGFEANANICTTLDKAVATGTPVQKLKKYLDAQWKNSMIESPETATYVGYPGQNDRWTDMSLQAIARRKKEAPCSLAALKKIPYSSLKGEDRINFDLMKRDLEDGIEGQKFEGDYLVMSQLEGVHTDVPDTLMSMPTLTKKDYEDMISRLEKVPSLVQQNEVLMKEGLKRHVTTVKMFLEKVPAQFDRLLTPKIEDSPLYKPFAEIKTNISAADKAELQARAKDVIEHKVYPAMQELKEFVVKTYIPNARTDISFSTMPNGKAWYAFKVRTQTTTDMTPDQLHQLGLSEVTRITKEMEKVKDGVKFKGDLNAFNKFLLTDKRFYYDSADQLLIGYRDIAKRVDPELPKLFKTLPRLTYGVREMPPFKAVDQPAAYYEGGSLEAGRPGYFVANTSDLKGRPKWGMESLVMHESVPGHHLQISIAQELKGIPEFRRFGGYTAYVEGWGLYAEGLGDEMGMYKDPYSKYGQLSYEMWRAIRLVVDTGIHAKGWTRDQAIAYFDQHMPKARKETENEVDRYITWPGQALAYKVGQLKFRELRDRAKAELGAKFDLREFHDEVLRHGPLPLDVLDKTVNRWIASQKRLSESPAAATKKAI